MSTRIDWLQSARARTPVAFVQNGPKRVGKSPEIRVFLVLFRIWSYSGGVIFGFGWVCGGVLNAGFFLSPRFRPGPPFSFTVPSGVVKTGTLQLHLYSSAEYYSATPGISGFFVVFGGVGRGA